MSYKRWISLSLATCVAFSTLYWALSIRPFLWVQEATLHMAVMPIVAECAGTLKTIPFGTGDHVPSGSSLFTLSSELLEAKQKHKSTILGARQLQLRKKRAQIDQSMQNYLSLRTDLELGRALPQAVEQELFRFQTAQMQYDEAESALETSKAESNYLEQQLSKMSLLAPKNLLVLRQCKVPGEPIAAGEMIYLLADPSQTWVEALIPEEKLSAIAIGHAVTIYFTAYPKAQWEGRLLSIGPELLPDRKIAVKISLDKGPRKALLRSGLTAQVRIKK